MINGVSVDDVEHVIIVHNVRLKRKLTEAEYHEYMRIANLSLLLLNEMFKNDIIDSDVAMAFAVKADEVKSSVVELNKQRGNLKLVTGNNDGN